MCLQHILKSEFNVNIYLYAYMITAHSEMQPHPELWVQLWFFSSCNFKLGDSEQNNDLNLQVHECCMLHTLKNNVNIWHITGFNVGKNWVFGKCISRCMMFVFSVLEFQIWLTYAWFASLCCVFVAVYFYWFYMCRHCSLSCETHLVNNMTIF